MPSLRRAGTRVRLVALALTMVLPMGCGSSSPSGSPVPGATDGAGPSGSPTSTPATTAPLVIDTDLGADDLMAISYVTTQADYEIRAITVAGTGLVHCLPGETNARDLLNELNEPAVPVACGPEEPLAGGTEFPAEWRSGADDRYGVTLAQLPGEPAGDAAATLAEVLIRSPEPVTILALGPLTNIASALRADGRVAGRIARLVIMGGALDVPGNATPQGGPAPAEWNFAADPTAAAEVLASGIPITLVPLDATNDVPLSPAFVERLREDDAAGPANLVSEMLSRNAYAVGVDYLWDQLAAVALIDQSVLALDDMRLAVASDGTEAGRLVRQAGGAPVTVATGADEAAFQDRFLAGLRTGGPRRTPFVVAGDLMLSFDGTTCVVDAAPSLAAGTYEVRFANRSTVDTGGVLARIRDGSTYQDLLDWLGENPEIIEQPPMVEILGFVVAGAGSDAQALITMPTGTAFPVCQAVDPEANQIVLGDPFAIE